MLKLLLMSNGNQMNKINIHMKISEFENTEWGAGMLAIINDNILEIISVDFSDNEICVLYNGKSFWLPCCFVELVNN